MLRQLVRKHFWIGGLVVGLWFVLPSNGLAQECDLGTLQPLEACKAELGLCRVDLGDDDDDGVFNLFDECDGTGAVVDSAGCTQTDFCTDYDATTLAGRRQCRRADWLGNGVASGLALRPGDCELKRLPKNPDKLIDLGSYECVSAGGP